MAGHDDVFRQEPEPGRTEKSPLGPWVVPGLVALISLLVMAIVWVIAGWFGVGLFSMMALSAAVRVDLFDDHGHVHSFDAPRSIAVAARRIEARQTMGSEPRRAEILADKRRRRLYRLANLFFGTVMVVSFWIFFRNG